MWAIFYVLFNLALHTTPLERTDIAIDLLGKAYPNWVESYEVGGFDCSIQSAFMQDYLRCFGVDSKLIVKKKSLADPVAHAWVELVDVPGKAVECTELRIVDSSRYRDYTVTLMSRDPAEFTWWNCDYLTGGDGE